MAGDTNEEIRQRLHRDGYQTISNQALTRYRKRPFVRRWVESRDDLACQAGFACFAYAVSRLDAHAKALWDRLYMGEQLAAGRNEVLLPLSREFRETVKDLRALVKEKRVRGADELEEGEAAEAGGPAREEIHVVYFDDTTSTSAHRAKTDQSGGEAL